MLAAGCGDAEEDGPAGEPAPTSGSGGTVIAALGDSIMAGNPAYDPDPGARAAYRRLGEIAFRPPGVQTAARGR